MYGLWWGIKLCTMGKVGAGAGAIRIFAGWRKTLTVWGRRTKSLGIAKLYQPKSTTAPPPKKKFESIPGHLRFKKILNLKKVWWFSG